MSFNFSLWKFVLFYLAEILLIILLYPGDLIEQTTEKERQWMIRDMGTEVHNSVTSQANDTFNALLVETGILQMTTNHVIPADPNAPQYGMEGFGKMWFDYLEDRLAALDVLIYFIFFRFWHLVLWLPFIGFLLVPAAWDGYCTWRIKRTSAAYSSPVLHGYSTYIIKFTAMAVLVLFATPIALHPYTFPIALALVSAMLGLAISNMPKRI